MLLSDPCMTKGWGEGSSLWERSGLQSPKSLAGREILVLWESFGFHCVPGPCHVVAGQTQSRIWERCTPRGMPGGDGSQGRAAEPPRSHTSRVPGRGARAPGPAREAPRLPRADTHRTAVLLQRHKLAPDVDRLEVVEVLLPLRAGRSRQEQPRRHQCSHHDWLPSWRRCEGKIEAWGPSVGGGQRRLRRRAAGEAGRAPSPSVSLALEHGALDLSLPTGTGGASDCAPVPGPQKHGLGILTAETILIMTVRLRLGPGCSDSVEKGR